MLVNISEIHFARVEKLEACMQDKGYVVLGLDQCGPLKAPTGKCN
ncbi:MAG: hypothetical protein WAK61_08160 [Leclercia sp.]